MKNWIKRDFFRTLVDQHIPNIEGAFEQFDADAYADNMKKTGATASYVAAASCLGLCTFPTNVGLRHNITKTRDIFGETVNACRARGLDVIGYMNSWGSFVCDAHPDWNVRDSKGNAMRDNTRYGNPCVNNEEFRKFICGIAAEIVGNYDVQALWIDMTGIWMPVCFCNSCKKKYFEKTGRELPTVVDLNDPTFMAYFKFKRECVAEYQRCIRETALAIKPNITVTFQSALIKNPFFYGQGAEFCAECDYLSGDFHADLGLYDGNVIARMYQKLTNNLPYEYMIGRCAGTLEYHTMYKPFGEMIMTGFSALMNQGAFMLIDAIDPAGTLNADYYERVCVVTKTLAPYIPYINYEDKAKREVAVYFNFEACAEHEQNGLPIDKMKSRTLFKRCGKIDKALGRAHLDYDVITKKNLAELGNYKVLVLSSLEALSQKEVDAIREYVRNGGCVYASGYTSIRDDEGNYKNDFMLADVFGIKYEGVFDQDPCYISPTDAEPSLFGIYTAKYPHMLKERFLKATATSGRTLATVTLPYSIPQDYTNFAAAISDPPVNWTDYVAVQENTFGKGRAIWVAGKPEDNEVHDNAKLFADLVLHLLGTPALVTDAPECVRHSVYQSGDVQKLYLLNQQLVYPPITIRDMTVTLNMGDKKVESVTSATGEAINWAQDGAKLTVKTDLEVCKLLLIK